MSSSPKPSSDSGDWAPVVTEYLNVYARRPSADLLLLTVVGEIDFLTAGALTRVFGADLPATTVLDLCGVSLLSAAGLRAIESVVARAAAADRRFLLVTDNPAVTQLLRLIDVAVPKIGRAHV